MRSRLVFLRPPGAGNGEATKVLSFGPPVFFDTHSFFVAAYPALKQALSRHQRQGVVLMLFDGTQPVAELWLEASLDQARVAVVGRHNHCDLVAGAPGLSLRHLAVLVRATSLDELRVRVLDLNTEHHFYDEAGRPLMAVMADGPLFLRVGGLNFVALRTPEPGGWPDDPEAAYRSLPERLFLEEKDPQPVRPRVRAPHDPQVTRVLSMPRPLAETAELCGENEPPRGRITLHLKGDLLDRRIGSDALSRGVLLGRYERCQLSLGNDSMISRVHLLLVAEGDEVLAVDTGSTNGTEYQGRQIRIHRLEDGDSLELAGELTTTWRSLA